MKKINIKRIGWSVLVVGFLIITDITAAFAVTDTTPPTNCSVLINGGAASTTSLSVNLALSATDTGSGMLGGQMKISNTDANWSSVTAVPYATSRSWTLAAGSSGSRTVYVRFRDTAGNWTTTSVSDSITYAPDTTPPTSCSVLINGGDTSAPILSVNLTLSAADSESGMAGGKMKFSNDNLNWSVEMPYATTSQWMLAPGSSGSRSVYARFADTLGNWTTTSVSDSITYAPDTTPPTSCSVSINGGAASTTSLSVNLTLSATDTGSGMLGGQMKISNTNPTDWSSVTAVPYATSYPWTLAAGASGTRYVYARFSDTLGNWTTTSASDSINYNLDTSPPTSCSVSINGGAASTTSLSVNLTLSATDTGSGMLGGQMKISNTNPTDWSSVTAVPYATSYPWTLAAGTGGTRYVYARFADTLGNWTTTSVSDSITYTPDVSPPTNCSVLINGGAASTTSLSVNLTLSATDTGSGMLGGQMKISNTDANWSSVTAVPYATSYPWTLAAGAGGTRLVYARFSDAAGNWTTTSVSDSIDYVVAPVANFTATPQSGISPLSVSFDGSLSTGGSLSYSWYFGDPDSWPPGSNTSTLEKPRHDYYNITTSAKTFPVTLTVSNTQGTDTLSKTITVNPTTTFKISVTVYQNCVGGGVLPGVAITCNGTTVGSTDQYGHRDINNLPRGNNYTIRGTLSGWTIPSQTQYLPDPNTVSGNGIVHLIASRENHPPTANSQSVTTDEDNAKAITLTGSDPDGDSISFSIVSYPTNGTLTGVAPNVTYTPNTGYRGSDSFTFKVNDGWADSNIANVDITVLERPYFISAKVVKAGTQEGIAGIEVFCDSQSRGFTGSDGTLRINLTQAGTYKIGVGKQGYMFSPAQDVTLTSVERQKTVIFDAKENILVIFMKGFNDEKDYFMSMKRAFEANKALASDKFNLKIIERHSKEWFRDWYAMGRDFNAEILNCGFGFRPEDINRVYIISLCSGTLRIRAALILAKNMADGSAKTKLIDFYRKTKFYDISPLLGGSSMGAGIPTWLNYLQPREPSNAIIKDIFSPQHCVDIQALLGDRHYIHEIFGDPHNRMTINHLAGRGSGLAQALLGVLDLARLYNYNSAVTNQENSVSNALTNTSNRTIYFAPSEDTYTRQLYDERFVSLPAWYGASCNDLSSESVDYYADDLQNNTYHKSLPEMLNRKHVILLYYESLIRQIGEDIFGAQFSSPSTTPQGRLNEASGIDAGETKADINSDGVIDAKDVTCFMQAYGTYIDERNYNPRTDLDSNGVVDESDLEELDTIFVPSAAILAEDLSPLDSAAREKLSILSGFGPPSILGDLNFDGIVDNADISIINAHLNQSGLNYDQGDVNSDGVVNSGDLTIAQGNLNKSVGKLFGAPTLPIRGGVFKQTDSVRLEANLNNYTSFSWTAVDERGRNYSLSNKEMFSFIPQELSLPVGRYSLYLHCTNDARRETQDYSADIEINNTLNKPDALITGAKVYLAGAKLNTQVNILNIGKDASAILKVFIDDALDPIKEISVSLPANQQNTLSLLFDAPQSGVFNLRFELSGIENELTAENNTYIVEYPIVDRTPLIEEIIFTPLDAPDQLYYITAKIKAVSGKEITMYCWDLDGAPLASSNKPSLTLKLDTLTQGNHTLSLRVRDAVGWESSLVTKIINCFTTTLYPGWNLLSIPLIPFDSRVGALLRVNGQNVFAGAVWGYSSSGYYSVDRLVAKNGYWVYAPLKNPVTLKIFGDPINEDPGVITLKSGWNLIGSPFNQDVPLSEIEFQIGTDPPRSFDNMRYDGWITPYFFFWPPYAVGYDIETVKLGPWKGYWVYSFVEGLKMNMPRPQGDSGRVLIPTGTRASGDLIAQLRCASDSGGIILDDFIRPVIGEVYASENNILLSGENFGKDNNFSKVRLIIQGRELPDNQVKKIFWANPYIYCSVSGLKPGRHNAQAIILNQAGQSLAHDFTLNVPTYGNVLGKISVPGGVASYNLVTIYGPGVTRITFTDDKGKYRINGLPIGQYRIYIDKSGYQTINKDIKIIKGNNSKNFKLIPISP